MSRYSCVGPREAVVADNAVANEIARPGRDVDELHRPDGLYRNDAEVRIGADREPVEFATPTTAGATECMKRSRSRASPSSVSARIPSRSSAT